MSAFWGDFEYEAELDADALDPRPCNGRNSNICVAEGCYGEACCDLGWRPSYDRPYGGLPVVECPASHDFEAMNKVSSVDLWECFACGAAV